MHAYQYILQLVKELARMKKGELMKRSQLQLDPDTPAKKSKRNDDGDSPKSDVSS